MIKLVRFAAKKLETKKEEEKSGEPLNARKKGDQTGNTANTSSPVEARQGFEQHQQQLLQYPQMWPYGVQYQPPYGMQPVQHIGAVYAQQTNGMQAGMGG